MGSTGCSWIGCPQPRQRRLAKAPPMTASPWLNQLCRHGASSFGGLLLALLIAPAL